MNKFFIILLLIISQSIFAFENGFVLNGRFDLSGSYTMPSISKSDLNKLGANYMRGNVGFIKGGEVEIGYIFGSKQYFKMEDNNIFSGLGAFFNIGISEGFAGQVSGAVVSVPGGEMKQVDVYFNATYAPVITTSLACKAYFLKNRVAIGLALGTRVIADMNPKYQFYASEDLKGLEPEVGTLIVTKDMMKKMNPASINIKVFAEYNIPIIETLELILGGYMAYDIYKPKYITMPPKLMKLAQEKSGFDPSKPVESYFINSLNFGIRLGLGLRL